VERFAAVVERGQPEARDGGGHGAHLADGLVDREARREVGDARIYGERAVAIRVVAERRRRAVQGDGAAEDEDEAEKALHHRVLDR
jgi:hypothetical protein